MVKTLTYVLLGRDELSPVAERAGRRVEGTFARLGKMAGMLGLTRCAALEGAPHGVTCVAVRQA